MITPELQSKVDQRLAALLVKVREKFPEFATPRVVYYDNKRAAGQAHYREHSIGINSVMLVENEESMLRETVAHELAHLVVHHAHKARLPLVFGARPKPHGGEWQRCMRFMFGVEPERTHNYSLANVRARATRTYRCMCACRTHEIGVQRYRRMLAGVRYRCKLCKTALRVTP